MLFNSHGPVSYGPAERAVCIPKIIAQRVRCAQLRALRCGRCRATACGGGRGGTSGGQRRELAWRGEDAGWRVGSCAREGAGGKSRGGRDARARALDSLITCHIGHVTHWSRERTDRPCGRQAVRVPAPKFLWVYSVISIAGNNEISGFRIDIKSICYCYL